MQQPATRRGRGRCWPPIAHRRVTRRRCHTSCSRMHRRPSSRKRLYWIGGGAWAASSVFLLSALGSYPIELWDESRVAVNALEMFVTGHLLVVTYGFEPDLWNTKPPLLIWLMNASMSVFGPSEWAVRLPSAVAAAGTVAVTMWFAWRLTRSVSAVVLAGALLAASRGF